MIERGTEMNSFLVKFKEKCGALFAGRYGFDRLFRPIVCISLVLLLVDLFVENMWWSIGLYALSLAIFVVAVWRVLSKDISARSLENSRYLAFVDSVKRYFNNWKIRIKERKTSCFKKCPKCKQIMRLPRRKGKHTARCPKCHNEFKVTIR